MTPDRHNSTSMGGAWSVGGQHEVCLHALATNSCFFVFGFEFWNRAISVYGNTKAT